MKTVLVTEAVRNFSAVLVSLESEQKEILLVRNDHPVARLVPEPESMDALGVFGDLHGTLDDETADEMLRSIVFSRSRVPSSPNYKSPQSEQKICHLRIG